MEQTPTIEGDTSTQQRILAATAEVLSRNGKRKLSLSDVAAQAGVSKGTPYLYFESKQALFIALHEEWDCGLADRVNAAIAALPEAGRRSPRRWPASPGPGITRPP